MEDSGGMWLEEMEDSCYPFDKEFVESQLDAMSFPEHEQKKEIASTYNLIDDLGSIEKLKKLYNKFKNMTPEEFDIMIRDTLRYLDMEDESDLLNYRRLGEFCRTKHYNKDDEVIKTCKKIIRKSK